MCIYIYIYIECHFVDTLFSFQHISTALSCNLLCITVIIHEIALVQSKAECTIMQHPSTRHNWKPIGAHFLLKWIGLIVMISNIMGCLNFKQYTFEFVCWSINISSFYMPQCNVLIHVHIPKWKYLCRWLCQELIFTFHVTWESNIVPYITCATVCKYIRYIKL